MNDMQRHDDATPIRDAQTNFIDKSVFSLDLPAVQDLFQNAGIARSMRTLQRYCENGSLDARKYHTETGAMWLVMPSSAETKIAETLEVAKTVEVLSTPDNEIPTSAVMSGAQGHRASETVGAASDNDEQRQTLGDAPVGPSEHMPVEETTHNDTLPGSDSELVTFLMKQVEEKDKQLTAKDEQITSLMKTHELDRLHLLQAWEVINTGFELPASREESDISEEGEVAETEVIAASEIKPEQTHFSPSPHPTLDDHRV